MVCFLWTRRAEATARLLAVILAGATVLSLGPRLRIAGHATLWLPGALLFQLPVMDNDIPARFALYAALTAAVVVSLWLAAPGRTRWWRWVVVGTIFVSLAPAANASLWWKPAPRAILHNQLARVIPRGSTVISLPFWAPDDRGLYAQAVAGMSFRLDDSWLQAVPAQDRPALRSITLVGSRLEPSQVPALERALCALGARYAVVWNDRTGRGGFLAALKIAPVRVDELLVYRLPRSACRPP
jgi:hypothetical protein